MVTALTGFSTLGTFLTNCYPIEWLNEIGESLGSPLNVAKHWRDVLRGSLNRFAFVRCRFIFACSAVQPTSSFHAADLMYEARELTSRDQHSLERSIQWSWWRGMAHVTGVRNRVILLNKNGLRRSRSPIGSQNRDKIRISRVKREWRLAFFPFIVRGRLQVLTPSQDACTPSLYSTRPLLYTSYCTNTNF